MTFTFWAVIACVLVFSRATVRQHPRGTSMIASVWTLNRSPTAAGVTMAVALLRGSPVMARETEMAPAVPPAATAMLPSALTRYRARHWLVMPRSVMMPLPSRWQT